MCAKRKVNVENSDINDVAVKKEEVKDPQKRKIRILTNGIYDIQALRVATGNRLVSALRPEFGLEIPKVDEELLNSDDDELRAEAMKQLDEAKKKLDSATAAILKEYKNITEYFATEFGGKGNIERCIEKMGPELAYIKSDLDYNIVRTYKILVEAEQNQLKVLEQEVKKHPMWDRFFADVKGCGTQMAAVCISYFDPHKARHPSSFWKYAGVDVTPDGHGRTKSDTVTQEYIGDDGKKHTREGLGYNPFVKAKLVGVLSTCFLRAGEGSKYNKCYYDYRHRLESREDMQVSPRACRSPETGFVQEVRVKKGDMVAEGDVVAVVSTATKQYAVKAKYNGKVDKLNLHEGDRVRRKQSVVTLEVALLNSPRIHRMALRYCVKMFLLDMWVAWRELEGYDVSDGDYATAKLGHKPHGYNEAYDGPLG